MPCSHGRLLGEGTGWLEPRLVEPGWSFRGLACLELADQANVWLCFRLPRTLALLIDTQVQSPVFSRDLSFAISER